MTFDATCRMDGKTAATPAVTARITRTPSAIKSVLKGPSATALLRSREGAIARDHGNAAGPSGPRKARDLSVPTGHFDRQSRLFGGQARFCSPYSRMILLDPWLSPARIMLFLVRIILIVLGSRSGSDYALDS
ncbi:MAG: hypothetical protein V6Z86_06720 [Hyphomicrobiales bacterium]